MHHGCIIIDSNVRPLVPPTESLSAFHNGFMQGVMYARVSTTQGQSVEMRLRDLSELAVRRGFEIIREYYD